MKKLKLLQMLALGIGLMLLTGNVRGQIISQYVETNSGTIPKGIEIWNNTASTLDFSINNLIIQQGTNGGVLTDLAGTIVNSGTLASGDVLVIGNQEIGTYLTDQGLTEVTFVSFGFSFNGDDALAVKFGGNITDIFGNPGSDPGSSWSGNGVSTVNQNIALNTGITSGASAWTDPSLRFSTISTTPATLPAGLSGFGVAPSGGTTPLITVTPSTLTGFTYLVGSGPSAEQTFTISGANLTADISIAATTNYEISKTSGNGYTSPLTFTPAQVATPQTVYVRLKAGLAVGTYNNEDITATSTDADNKTVTCSGEVIELATEPTNHPTGFGATANSSSQITVSWTDAEAGSQAPSGYLILANTTGTFSDPVDGVAQADDTDMSDDAGVKNIPHGSDGSYQWQGLNPATTYYFKIFAYNGSGLTINYKVDGNELTANAQTLASQDNDTEAFEPVSQISGKLISSLADTEGEAEDVFKIVIEDQGTNDGLATKVTNIRVKPHITNNADWTDAIQEVFVDNGTNYIYPTATITDEYIDLAFGASDLNVANGLSVDVTLWIYLNTSNIVDGSIISFMVDADDHGFTADATGSGFANSFLLGDFNSGDFTIGVEATKLTFVQQPSNVLVDAVMSPAVTVAFTDANNNTDVDYDGTGFEITLSTTGTFAESATTEVAPVNGFATFSNLIFSATGTGVTITATDENSWFVNNTVLSSSFNVTEGPTVLAAGDIVFVSYSVDDSPDRYAFVTFVALNGSTKITITENGWKADNTWRTGESTIEWTCPVEGLPAGTVVEISGTTANHGSVNGSALALANNGDQIIAYQGLSTAPTFIAAANLDWAVWQDDATNSNTSAIPTGLINLVSANAIQAENGFYSGPYSGTINFLSSAINNPANWTTSSSGGQTWPTWAFIYGASTTLSQNATVFNLLIDNTEGLTINSGSQLTVNGTLTNNAGTTGLLIKSDATGTGSLIHSTADVPATVERYITGANEAWHLLSSPVEIQAITGDFIPSGTYPDGSGYDFYTWYEPASTWVNFKNTTTHPTWNTANGSNNFVVGRGYLVAYQATNPTKTFNGELNQGSVAYPLTIVGVGTYGSSNLVGNPFPSSIDWKAVSGWGRTNLAENISGGYDMHIYNAAAGNYGTFNSNATGNGTNGATQYIPPMQGFVVKASAAGDLTMNNSVRVHSDQAFLKSTEELADYLKLKVSGTANTYSDEVIIEFNHDNDLGGASKLFSFVAEAPGLYTVKDSYEYAIDFRGVPKEETIIPMHFRVGATGSYTLQALTLETFAEGVMIFLEDKKNGILHELTQTNAYTFNATKEDNPDRFVLHFAGAFSVDELNNDDVINIYANSNSIYFNTNAATTAQISVFNITGQQVYGNSMALDGVRQITLNVPTGWYVVKAVTGNNTVSRKVFIR